jgi:hypothetical protein
MAFGDKLKTAFKGLASQFDIEITENGIGFRDEPLSIDKFRSVMDSGARTNRYLVDIHCPKLGDISIEGLRCISATLPGRQLETTDFSEYGPIRKMPFNVGNDGGQISFTFLCDSSFTDRFIIEAWQTLIYSGETEANVGSSVNPQFMYYNDYIGEIDITQLRLDGGNALTYNLTEAYPVSFSPQPLSYETSDDIMKFEVDFAFRTFTTQYTNRDEGFIDGLNKGGKMLNALGGLASLLGKEGDAKNLQRFSNRISTLSGLLSPFSPDKPTASGVSSSKSNTNTTIGAHGGGGFGGSR